MVSLRREPAVAGALEVPVTADDVVPQWLSTALGLGAVTAVSTVPVGTGNVALTLRLDVTWADPEGRPPSFVIKLAAPDPVRRRAGMGYRAYEVEAAFYQRLAPLLKVRVPRCYWAGFDAEREAYAVVLEDLLALTPGDDVAGCDPAEAAAVLAELALLHGQGWNDPGLAGLAWFNRYPQGQIGVLGPEMAEGVPRLLDRFGDRIGPDTADVAVRFARVAARYDRKGFGGPRTITHGDVRNENVMFGAQRVCIFDWQTCQYGAALADVSYYLGGALLPEQRRAHEVQLLREYHERLVALGVTLKWDECWREYRRHALSLLTSFLKASFTMPMEGRTGDLVRLVLDRAARHVLDVESLELLEA